MNSIVAAQIQLLEHDGVVLPVLNGAVIAALTRRGFIGVASDGTNLRFILSDTSGRQVVVGAGTAGTPAGGVVSVQGISGGTDLAVKQGAAAALAAGWPIIQSDAAGNPIVNQLDAIDGIYRVPFVGKVSLAPPVVPPAAVRKTIFTADADLVLNGAGSPDDQTLVITNGKTFTVSTVEGGAQGDPTESGSRIDVIYYDGTTEHLVSRLYVVADTTPQSPQTDTALDGTVMTGDGSTKTIIMRRIRLSNGGQQLFGLVVGHEI